MRSLLILLPLCACFGATTALAASPFANGTADRAAIDRVVRTLNESPQSPGLFAADVDGSAELARVTQKAFSNSKFDPSRPGETRPGGLVISHEPMGEASWNPFSITLPAVVSAPPRFVVQSLRFIAPDVALLDTFQEYYDLGSPAQRFPVLLVLKRGKKSWQIVSLRAMAK